MKELITDAEKLVVIYDLLKDAFSKDGDDKIGLYDGDTGLLLFLYYYGYFKNDEQVVSCADELTQQILSKIPLLKEDSFQSGKMGIGWTLDHLSKMKFIDTSDSFLDHWDDLCLNFSGNKKFSLKNGTLGYATFLLGRLNYSNLTCGNIDEKLKEHYKALRLIRYMDEIEGMSIEHYDKWELISVADIDKFFTIDLVYLHDFVADLCDCLVHFNNVMDCRIYPEIVLRNIKRISSELLQALNILLLEKSKTDQQDKDQVSIYMATICHIVYSLLYTCGKKHVTIDIQQDDTLQKLIDLHNSLKSNHPSYLYSISTFNNRTLQLLHKIKRLTGCSAIEEIRADMKNNMFGYIQHDNFSEKNLVSGLSGYGLSILAGIIPEYDAWDQAIGLS